jgi:hypothetical protein
VLVVKQFDTLYGSSEPQQRFVDLSTDDGAFYYHQIKPILENRCVAWFVYLYELQGKYFPVITDSH